MAFIVTRLTENHIQLGREELIRKLPFGTNWRFLRIAALISINSNGAWTPGTDVPPWWMGVTQGPYGILTENTVDALGIGLPIQSQWGNQWLFTNSSQFNQLNIQTFSAGGWAQKLGQVWTTNNLTQIGCWFGCNSYNATPFHTALMVDITKGTIANSNPASYSLNFWCPAGLQAADLSVDTFFNQIQNPQSMANMTPHAWNFTAAGNLLHDYALFSWSRDVPSIELAEFCVIRFA